MITFKQGNAFNLIKQEEDLSFDIIFSDPPYSLGSQLETKDYTNEIISKIKAKEIDSDLFEMIHHNNKLGIKGTGSDFMKAWDSPKGRDWEVFFKEAFRTLKHGGYCILYGMEEVGALFNYYASMAGFSISQSIYYFYGSSFPKNLDLSKAIDKRLGEERKKESISSITGSRKSEIAELRNDTASGFFGEAKVNYKTTSTSSLGQKYEGYKAGKKPLKANTEVIFVFHKPTKYGSYIEDLLAYENGEKDIHVSAWDIDNNRILDNNSEHVMKYEGYSNDDYKSKYEEGTSYKHGSQIKINMSGRYPSQLLFDPEMAKRLDEQSGTLKSGKDCVRTKVADSYHGNFGKEGDKQITYGDEGGASRFFEVIPYLDSEQEKFIFSAKVSKYERNAGLNCFEDKERFGAGNYSTSPKCSICKKTINGTNDHSVCEKDEKYKLIYERTDDNSIQKNNHPTLKSMLLNKKILDLIKTPNREDETICIPFSGVWSEIIPSVASGFKEENITAYEINEEYPIIGKARYNFWKENDFFFQIEDKKEFQKKKKEVEKKESSVDKKKELDYYELPI